MDLEKRFDLYKEMYYYELQHRDSITEHISWSLPVIAALGGAILYLMREVPQYPVETVRILHMIAAVASLLCWTGAVIYMAQAWWGVEYGYLTSPAKLEAWFGELQAHEARYPGATPAGVAFAEGIVGVMCEVTRNNRVANQRKSWKHHVSKRWLAAAAAPLVLALLTSYVWGRSESSAPGALEHERQADSAATAAPSSGGVLPGGK